LFFLADMGNLPAPAVKLLEPNAAHCREAISDLGSDRRRRRGSGNQEGNIMRIAVAAIFAAIFAAPSAHAQAPAAPAAPGPVPEVMPFDIPYGTPIGIDQAEKAIAAAAAEAKKHNWKMSISVVEPSGLLVAHHTMDGTQYASIEFSQAKARTAATYRRPSGLLQDAINTNGSPSTISLLVLTRGIGAAGGFPIVEDGKLVGAIGVSGGMFTQDVVTAKAGLEALGVK
jgi:uncharacterized protein GlcG (DUF336 family)